ncbi:hypothetical protein J7K74_02735 [Candidatus Woesearchaeota archaeon]|nr:hypothetical protein [Candidatus Woesearchaeota archaeon]
MRFRRKIYHRGSSYETTIPKPLLFFIDPSKKYDAVFEYDPERNRWYIVIEESIKEQEGKEK